MKVALVLRLAQRPGCAERRVRLVDRAVCLGAGSVFATRPPYQRLVVPSSPCACRSSPRADLIPRAACARRACSGERVEDDPGGQLGEEVGGLRRHRLSRGGHGADLIDGVGRRKNACVAGAGAEGGDSFLGARYAEPLLGRDVLGAEPDRPLQEDPRAPRSRADDMPPSARREPRRASPPAEFRRSRQGFR